MAREGVIERYGVPRALYTDRKSVYVTDRPPTLEEQLAQARALPSKQNQFQRYHLNVWTEQEHRWLDMNTWEEQRPRRALEGRRTTSSG